MPTSLARPGWMRYRCGTDAVPMRYHKDWWRYAFCGEPSWEERSQEGSAQERSWEKRSSQNARMSPPSMSSGWPVSQLAFAKTTMAWPLQLRCQFSVQVLLFEGLGCETTATF